MNVIEIVKDYLHNNGYDGLVDLTDDCGCSLDDLMPCDGYSHKCVPARCQIIYIDGCCRDAVMVPAKEVN